MNARQIALAREDAEFAAHATRVEREVKLLVALLVVNVLLRLGLMLA